MPHDLRIFVATSSDDVQSATGCGAPCAYLFYQIAENGALMRTGLPAAARGGVMGICGELPMTLDLPRLTRDIASECVRRGYSGVLLDLAPTPACVTLLPSLSEQLARRNIPHFAPVEIASAVPYGRVVVPSALSGGDYRALLAEYAARFGLERVSLEIVRICSDFLMPSMTPDGVTLSSAQFAALLAQHSPMTFFSRELCAKYFTYRDEQGRSHFLLFDDPDTAVKKLMLAREAGYTTAFVLWRDWGAATTSIVRGAAL